MTPLRLSPLSGSIACLVAFIGAGCGPSAHVAVEICGDVGVPDDVDAIRLLVRNEGETEALGGYVDLLDPWREPDDPCPAVSQHLPLHFDLVEGRGNVVVTAEGLRDGVVRLRSHARADFPVRGSVPVILSLEAACIGVSCARGQTCVAGRCERTPFGGASTCMESAPVVDEAQRCPAEEEEEEEGVET